MNDELLLRFSTVQFIILPTNRKPFFLWLSSVIKESFYRILSKKIPLGLSKITQAVSRRSDLLVNAISKVENADLVIGHNPGALYATSVAAEKFSCPSGFDVEDYHPGEGNDKHLGQITLSLMKQLLPKFDYVSFASNLIQKKVAVDLEVINKNWFSILNYFPKNEFVCPKENNDNTIKFVWFSQNINSGRGLENILYLFENEHSNIELHLFGNVDIEFYTEVLSRYNYIIIHQPLPQIELHHELANYDIGLALDIAIDENRDLAITNKILAYLQAGLYVMSSDISAHQFILNKYPNHGKIFTDSKTSISDSINGLIENIAEIRATKILRFNAFKNNNWEQESSVLYKNWCNLLF